MQNGTSCTANVTTGDAACWCTATHLPREGLALRRPLLPSGMQAGWHGATACSWKTWEKEGLEKEGGLGQELELPKTIKRGNRAFTSYKK